MASTSKMEYQVLSCIFHLSLAMASLGLKEMGKFLWEMEEKVGKKEGQGQRTMGQGPKTKDQGPKAKDQGPRSRTKDQGPCPGTNGHPGRVVDVILSQIKAPIEIFKSR